MFTNTWIEFWAPLGIVGVLGTIALVSPGLAKRPIVRAILLAAGTLVVVQALFVAFVLVMFSIAMAGFED